MPVWQKLVDRRRKNLLFICKSIKTMDSSDSSSSSSEMHDESDESSASSSVASSSLSSTSSGSLLRKMLIVTQSSSLSSAAANEDDAVEHSGLISIVGTTITVALSATEKKKRNKRVQYTRMNWNAYMNQYMNDPSFERTIRMSRPSFCKLVDLLRDKLVVDNNQAERRGGGILPEVCLYMTIRYLAGGSYLDITKLVLISTAAFYYCVRKTIQAICNCPELNLKFPTTVTECQAIAEGFRLVSPRESIVNCVGCVDGYLMQIETPSREDAGNVRSFFSGHYQCYGINIQAVCDSNCMFTYFAL
jgi:hypothetical protein